MILASWNAIPKKKLSEFLKGPAKVYDGAFDKDETTNWDQFEHTQPFSMLIAFRLDGVNSRLETVMSTRNSNEGGQGIFFLVRRGNNTALISLINGVGNTANALAYEFTNLKQNNEQNLLILTCDGNGQNTNQVAYLNDTPAIISTPNGGLSGSDTIINNNQIYIGGGGLNEVVNASVFKMTGYTKQLEIINRVATPQEIADASDPITGGSFRVSGITHNSGEYLFALNTDQSDGNPPTTFPDTPFYNITSFGGSQYVPYQSL